MHGMWQPLRNQSSSLGGIARRGVFGSFSFLFSVGCYFHSFIPIHIPQVHLMCRLVWVMWLIGIRLELVLLCFQNLQTFHYLSIFASVSDAVFWNEAGGTSCLLLPDFADFSLSQFGHQYNLLMVPFLYSALVAPLNSARWRELLHCSTELDYHFFHGDFLSVGCIVLVFTVVNFMSEH